RCVRHPALDRSVLRARPARPELPPVHPGRRRADAGTRPPPAAPAGLMRVSFLVPVYNEAATIGELLERVHALDLDKQVIVVDDGSTDATPELVEPWRERGVVFVRQRHAGKGRAVRTAIEHIDGDVAVIQDADLEYDPAEVPELIEPIRRGVADVVYGSRLSGGRPQRAYLFWHLVGNRFLSLLTNVLYNTTLSDMETGYKAFRADILR